MLINGEEGCENELNDSNFRHCFEKKKKKQRSLVFFTPKWGLFWGYWPIITFTQVQINDNTTIVTNSVLVYIDYIVFWPE